ncbi:oxysterols receptor LXR-alpha isoform X1 [Macaca nemestrina]|uniref:oxysterols receptor LXR-alpha isoform X1 n=1 Tax=Macaca nemestrina TaxID=9545 RepID=UPI0005F4257C
MELGRSCLCSAPAHRLATETSGQGTAPSSSPSKGAPETAHPGSLVAWGFGQCLGNDQGSRKRCPCGWGPLCLTFLLLRLCSGAVEARCTGCKQPDPGRQQPHPQRGSQDAPLCHRHCRGGAGGCRAHSPAHQGRATFRTHSVIKGARYVCHSGGHCPMDTYMRRKCQECRLRKCRQAGMREECVLSEEQIRLKKLKRQEEEQAHAISLPPRASSPPQILPQLSPEQLGMIEKLVAAQQQCNRRSFSDRLRVTPWPMAPDPHSREARQQRFAHFTELAIVSVQEIVDFAKQLPGFLQLSREDQIALLKTSAIEVAGEGQGMKGEAEWDCLWEGPPDIELGEPNLLGSRDEGNRPPWKGLCSKTNLPSPRLRSAACVQVMLLETSRRYNPGSESITFLKDFSYNREDFAKAGLQVEFINPIFEFSRAMNELQLNDAEFALLIAISIFSADRPNVQDQLQVERLQHTYVEALHAYVSIHHPHDRLMFPRMLMKLVSLRTLSSVHSEQVFALRLQDKKLPPLLSEIWDVHE